MTTYTSDRAFTDYIHQQLALPLVYRPLNWQPVELQQQTAAELDMFRGIDYVFRDSEGQHKTVQERFRECKYQRYGDFTIRYRRDRNPNKDRHLSEYYKMKADFFTYGITNGYKNNWQGCTDFLKYAIIDLKKVYEKIDSKQIIISDNRRNTCTLEKGAIICPVKHNRDGSSSFFPIEIRFLLQLWGNELIVSQKGFV